MIDGIIKNYHPDFIVDGIVYEIKGFKTKQSEAKSYYNPDIKCLFETEMQPYLQYAIERYGVDFIDVYE